MSDTLTDDFDEDEFESMQNDDVESYRIEFDDGTERETSMTAMAYFATLDPEADVYEA
jgi:hypothetical protein